MSIMPEALDMGPWKKECGGGSGCQPNLKKACFNGKLTDWVDHDTYWMELNTLYEPFRLAAEKEAADTGRYMIQCHGGLLHTWRIYIVRAFKYFANTHFVSLRFSIITTVAHSFVP